MLAADSSDSLSSDILCAPRRSLTRVNKLSIRVLRLARGAKLRESPTPPSTSSVMCGAVEPRNRYQAGPSDVAILQEGCTCFQEPILLHRFQGGPLSWTTKTHSRSPQRSSILLSSGHVASTSTGRGTGPRTALSPPQKSGRSLRDAPSGEPRSSLELAFGKTNLPKHEGAAPIWGPATSSMTADMIRCAR